MIRIGKQQLLFLSFSLILFIIIVSSSLDEKVNSISLYLLIPFLTTYSILRLRKEFFRHGPIIILLLLYAWMVLTGFIGGDLSTYFQGIKTMTGVVLFCAILYSFSLIEKKYIFLVYFLYSIKFLYFFYYSINNGLWETNINESRMRIEGINANTFGYFSYFAVIASFFVLMEYQTKMSKLLLWLLICLCVTTGIVTVFFAASRAGFIVTVGTSMIFVLLYFIYPLRQKSFIVILLAILLTSALLPRVTSLFKDSVIGTRFTEIDNDIRVDLFLKGIHLGFKHPIFGIGAGNYSSTHSSYAELFATHGIIGLFLFVMLILEAVKRSHELYSLGSIYRKYSLFFITFFIIYFFYNLFYWFYLNLFLLGFFFLVRAHLETILRNGLSEE